MASLHHQSEFAYLLLVHSLLIVLLADFTPQSKGYDASTKVKNLKINSIVRLLGIRTFFEKNIYRIFEINYSSEHHSTAKLSLTI